MLPRHLRRGIPPAAPIGTAAPGGGGLLLLGLTAALPALVLYALLFTDEQGQLPVFVPGVAASYLLEFGLTVGLFLSPLAVLPLRTRTYAALAGAGMALLLAANFVHVLEYGELLSVGAIDALARTNLRESTEYAAGRSGTFRGALAGTAAVAAAMALLVRGISRSHRLGTRVRLLLGALGMLAVGFALHHPRRLLPTAAMKNVYAYAQYRRHYQAIQAERAAFRFGAERLVAVGEPEVYVLVIGESVRRDHLPQYGYPRDTMPRVRRLASTAVFEDVVSTASATQFAVKAMLTPASAREVWGYAGKSVVALAGEVGFSTYWLSNQDRTGDQEIVLMADEAGEVHFTNHSWSAGGRYDEAVLPVLDQVLRGPAPRKFVVVHLVGSHDMYSRRYPPAFRVFPAAGAPRPPTPAGLTPVQQAIVDHYDNSIAYTDHVLAEVIERVAATRARAVVVYAPDHGENLFDLPARWVGHGAPTLTRHEVEIPLIAWYSPAFRAGRPDRVAALERNRRQPVSADDVFFALADLLGAGFEGMDARRSLFSPTFSPRPREVLTVDGGVVSYDCLRDPQPDCEGSQVRVAALR